jgi:hypothetical protein
MYKILFIRKKQIGNFNYFFNIFSIIEKIIVHLYAKSFKIRSNEN